MNGCDACERLCLWFYVNWMRKAEFVVLFKCDAFGCGGGEDGGGGGVRVLCLLG